MNLFRKRYFLSKVHGKGAFEEQTDDVDSCFGRPLVGESRYHGTDAAVSDILHAEGAETLHLPPCAGADMDSLLPCVFS